MNFSIPMLEDERFWEFYWDHRLQSMETLGKSEAILAASRLIRQITAQSDRRARVLELGCGEGQILGTLLDAHAQICDLPGSAGVDYNARSVIQARRSFPGPRWIEGDFTHPELLESLGKFDLVLLVNALHEVFSSAYKPDLGEVDAGEGKARVQSALNLSAGKLAEGGWLELFDGLEPPGDPEKVVLIRFLEPQTRAEFETFAREYHPFKIAYHSIGNGMQVELSLRDFTRYIDKSIFIGKPLWSTERLESYQYFTEVEFRDAFWQAGLEIASWQTLTVNEAKWRHRVEIVSEGMDFPQEHVLILAQRGK